MTLCKKASNSFYIPIKEVVVPGITMGNVAHVPLISKESFHDSLDLLLGSISPTFYVQHLHAQTKKPKNYRQAVSTFCPFWIYLGVKCWRN